MTFWKVSDTRMNCLITEAEIAALGYSLEDLTQDRERTEEFLNLLLKKGKEVLGLNTDNGIQGFYGAFLPDRSLMLSISCQAENSLESIQKDGSEASGMLIEPDSSEKETVRWCREMLQNSPMALRCLKAALNADCDGQAGLQELAGNATMLFYMTEEGQEGRNAFNEKRQPDFSKYKRNP